MKYFSEIFDKVRPQLDLGQTVGTYIQYHMDPQTFDDSLAAVISSNPVYWHFFEKVLKDRRGQMSSRLIDDEEDENHLEKPIRFLAFFGKKGSRNLLVALRKLKLQGDGWPKRSNETLSIKLEDVIPKTIELDDYLETHEISRSKVAIHAGLLYDFFDLVLEKNQWKSAVTLGVYEKAYEDGVRLGRMVYELVRGIEELDHRDWIFPCAFSLSLSHVLAQIFLDQSQKELSWEGFCEERGAYLSEAPEMIEWFYQIRLGVTPSEIAALLVRYFYPEKGLELPLRRCREPVFLKDEGKDCYHTSLAFYFGLALCERPQGFHLAPRESKWLPVFDLDASDLRRIQKKVLQLHPVSKKENGS